jgi:hypothetical protein
MTTWEDVPARERTAKQYFAAYEESLKQHLDYVKEASEKYNLLHPDVVDAHDVSKWRGHEFPYYANNFCGPADDPQGFAKARLQHIHYNPHHWQHWIFSDGFALPGADLENGIVEMPHAYVAEMVADWMASSRQYTGDWDMTDWLAEHVPKMLLHSKTKQYLIEEVLPSVGYTLKFSEDSLYVLGRPNTLKRGDNTNAP